MERIKEIKPWWVLSLIILVLSQGSLSYAQTNTFPADGNVGIGTASPSGKLVMSDGLGNDLRFEVGSDIFIGTVLGTDLRFKTNNVERMVIMQGGNVGIGTTSPTAKLHVAGNATVDGNIAAKYQDVAEWVRAPASLSPGTVVVIDPLENNRVVAASQPYDARIAGVISSQPGILLGEGGEDKVKVAHSGRVKVKVDAAYSPIEVGDILVSSATSGYAMRSQPIELSGISMHRPGTIVGKALEPLRGGKGEILVLLTLQ